MTEHASKLPGSWHKSSQEPCAAGYAAHLRFDADGLYYGSTEPPGGFTWWDQGTWALAGPGQLALSTANDEVITYAFSLIDDTLTFTDSTNCRFSYRRDG